MYKLGIPLIPIELLGYHLGLILNKKDKNLFWNVRTGKRPGAGYGTQMNKKQYDANAVFKKLRIPLKATNYPIVNFKTKKELITFISSRIKKDANLLVLLNSDVLNGTKNNNGHACVIDRIYPIKNTIRLIDPLPNQAKWREFKLDKLIRAMKLHPTGQGRLIELKRIRQ
ncbi:MAG: hypothetical protein WCT08_03725 [Patescibacteria group bacterium]|jgi:hypothetical protein